MDTENTQLTVIQNHKPAFSDPGDFIIPRLMLVQSRSAPIVEKRAKEGQVIDTRSSAVVCDIDRSVEVLLLYGRNWYVQYEPGPSGSKPKYIKSAAFVHGFTSGKWKHQVEENGKNLEWKRQLNLSVLLICDIEGYPHSVSLKGMSVSTARNLINYFMDCDHMKKPYYANVFSLSPVLKTFNGFTAYGYDAKKVRTATDVEFKLADKWATKIESGSVKESNDEEEVSESGLPAEEVPF